MIRKLWIILSACCFAAVLSESVGLGLLWSQGLLNAQRLREIRDLFGPQEKESAAADSETQPVLPSSQDVLRERSLRVLSLSSLETEVGLLKNMLETERAGLSGQNAEFQRQKEAFQAQLLKLADENTVAAREQARAVLLALRAPEAVDRLMQLSVEEDVVLMREMPEAKIALLLKEFTTAPEGAANPNATKEAQDRRTRAEQIFKRITDGQPRDSIIRSALGNLQQVEGERPPTTASNGSNGGTATK
jgi:hypothetical protein